VFRENPDDVALYLVIILPMSFGLVPGGLGGQCSCYVDLNIIKVSVETFEQL